jgi:hypothetical protein
MLDFLKTFAALAVFVAAAAVLSGFFWGLTTFVARWLGV